MSFKVGDIVMVLPSIKNSVGFYAGPIMQPLTITEIRRDGTSFYFKEIGQFCWAPYVVPYTSLMKELI